MGQYKATNGIYKLIPYYQKVSPEQLKAEESRFIIHKHVISGQWQLTEFDAYPLSKNIKAFPVTEENEKNALMIQSNRFASLSHRVQEQEAIIQNLNKDVKAKDNTIESLTAQNELLTDSHSTDLSHETIKDMKGN